MSILSVDARGIKGKITVPYSKSMAHRVLVQAFCRGDIDVVRSFDANSDDVAATKNCLLELADNQDIPNLLCGESGTTLRFMLPLAAALGRKCNLVAEGSLVGRPMQPLIDELNKHGASITVKLIDDAEVYSVSGKLSCGDYEFPGNVSSQFISGVILASSLIDGETWVTYGDELESSSYVEMTQYVVNHYDSSKIQKLLEGDWSSGAMWLVASYLRAGEIQVNGLNEESCQGDRVIIDILDVEDGFDAEISVKDCPDLAPAIALWAICRNGDTVITDTSRLRLKESDRQAAIVDILKQLGADIKQDRDKIVIHGSSKALPGSSEVVNTRSDHRMAMLAALASIVCEQPVLIENPEAVNKSYPHFFEDMEKLGGVLTQI